MKGCFARRILFFGILFFPYLSSDAQSIIIIGVNGLTCSQCTRSVEMQLRKLKYVQNVEMDLEHTNGKIFLKNERVMPAAEIAKAVRDAGFSLRFLKASIAFDKVPVSEKGCFSLNGKKYQIVDNVVQELNGKKEVQYLGREYVTKDEYDKWKEKLNDACGKGKNVNYITVSAQ